jgi:hypothetical protein
MEFSVNIEALAGLPVLLDRRARDLRAGRDYLLDNTRLAIGEGLLNRVVRGHGRVVGEVETFLLDAAGPYAERQADRIRGAIGSYRRVDAAAAARIDASLPLSPLPDRPAHRADPSAAAAIFEDGAEPSAHLRPPPDYTSRFPYQPDYTDLVSPSSVGRDAVWCVTSLAAKFGLLDRGYDPFEAFVKPVSGDWAGLYACGDVFDNLALELAESGGSVAAATRPLDQVWTGNAADGCGRFLDHFGHTLAASTGPLSAIAKEYRAAAQGAADLGELIGTLLSELLDHTAFALLNATTEGAFTLPQLLDDLRVVVRAVKKLIDMVSAVDATLTALQASLNAFGIIQGHHPLPGLPTASAAADEPALPR